MDIVVKFKWGAQQSHSSSLSTADSPRPLLLSQSAQLRVYSFDEHV